jgi:hypothetical protein
MTRGQAKHLAMETDNNTDTTAGLNMPQATSMEVGAKSACVEGTPPETLPGWKRTGTEFERKLWGANAAAVTTANAAAA